MLGIRGVTVSKLPFPSCNGCTGGMPRGVLEGKGRAGALESIGQAETRYRERGYLDIQGVFQDLIAKIKERPGYYFDGNGGI